MAHSTRGGDLLAAGRTCHLYLLTSDEAPSPSFLSNDFIHLQIGLLLYILLDLCYPFLFLLDHPEFISSFLPIVLQNIIIEETGSHVHINGTDKTKPRESHRNTSGQEEAGVFMARAKA